MSLSDTDKRYLQRCNQLAEQSLGHTYPNPMVGAVIVHQNKIISEGYHLEAGKPHAEVLAIESVKDKSLLPKSTLYVSLEPCNHYGKTPPCSKLIVESAIPKVVIDRVDPNPKVNHSGIDFLRAKGVEVLVNEEVKKPYQSYFNKRFFTFHESKRPYIILKWAESADGYIDGTEKEPLAITHEVSKQLSHKWRTEEEAILVGTQTVLKDNPQLNARLWEGKENYKFIIDKNLSIPKHFRIFEQNKVYVFNAEEELILDGVNYIRLNFDHELVSQMLSKMYEMNIQSLIIEGGAQTLQHFIEGNYWDEARVFTNPNLVIERGIKAPVLRHKTLMKTEEINTDLLQIFYNV